MCAYMIVEKTVLVEQNVHYNELCFKDKRYILYRKCAVVPHTVINQFRNAPFSRVNY